MSLYSRARRKRKRNFKVFIENSENIEGVYVFQIYQIPEKIDYSQEFDFWIVDAKDCYMLRIEKGKEQVVYFSRDNQRNPIYCTMKVDIDCIDIREQLRFLKTIGVPYKMKGKIKRKVCLN